MTKKSAVRKRRRRKPSQKGVLGKLLIDYTEILNANRDNPNSRAAKAFRKKHGHVANFLKRADAIGRLVMLRPITT